MPQCHLWQYDVSVNATFTLAGRNLTLMVMAPSFYLAHKQLNIFNMQIPFFVANSKILLHIKTKK